MLLCLEIGLFLDIVDKLCDGQTDLLHGIAIPYGDGLILQGVKVNGDAKRSADLVLTAIALTDGAGLVIVHHKALCQHLLNFTGLVAQLVLLEGQHGSLEGSKGGMQAQYVAAVAVFKGLLVVCVTEEG